MTQLLDNRYRILHRMAEGGFGTTFLAEDMRTPSQRRCVVKQLKPNASEPTLQAEFNSRFTREAAVLEDLGQGHLQIPLLYAYFEENSQFYLVQEYIQGKTLTQQVQADGAWDAGKVRSLLEQLLSIVSYIHDRGIIHRDIKPDNIILRESDGLPVLIDFGAVKDAVGAGRLPAGNQSQSGPVSLVIGTPGFMAPEQGVGRPVFSSDLYALGLNAIYCLTGLFPQDLNNDPHTGQIHWQPARSGLSPSLMAVLNQMIAPHPSDRFPNAAAILQALSTVDPSVKVAPLPTQVVSPGLQGQETTFGQAPQVSQSRRKKPPNLLLIGSLFLAIAATSGLVTALLSNRSSQQTTVSAPQVTESAPPPSPEVATPQPSSAISVTPRPSTSPTVEPTFPTVELTPDIAETTVSDFYEYLSNQDWNAALALTNGRLAQAFDPTFFEQFQRVTVSNLRVTTQTDNTFELLGQNTYLYPDGTRQEEERTFTVQLIDEQPQIVDSTFVRVTKLR